MPKKKNATREERLKTAWDYGTHLGELEITGSATQASNMKKQRHRGLKENVDTQVKFKLLKRRLNRKKHPDGPTK